MKDDLISRREALDALEKEKPTPFVNKDGSVDPFGAGRQNQWYRDGIAIMNLPSAQPGEDIRAMCGECDAWNRYKNYPQPGWTTDVNDILAYLDGVVHPIVSPENWNVYSELYDMVSGLLKPWEGEPNE